MTEINENFIKEIEEIVWMKDVSTLDAIVIYCEKHNIEPESIAPFISKLNKIKDTIYREAEKLNLVKKMNRFPGE